MNRVSVQLRRAGHKITTQRLAIAKVVIDTIECLTPAAVYEKVHRIDPRVGLVTVYRTLTILHELGLVCEVHLSDNTHGYVGCPVGHHDHLICSDCGKVINFTRCNVLELESRLTSETGFAINEHHLEFYGKCPDCRDDGVGGHDNG